MIEKVWKCVTKVTQELQRTDQTYETRQLVHGEIAEIVTKQTNKEKIHMRKSSCIYVVFLAFRGASRQSSALISSCQQYASSQVVGSPRRPNAQQSPWVRHACVSELFDATHTNLKQF